MKKLIKAIILTFIISMIFITNIYAGQKGDVDFNGAINATDALQVLKHSAKIITLSSIKEADIDLNNTVDAKDALFILKYAAKLIPDLTYETISATPKPTAIPISDETIATNYKKLRDAVGSYGNTYKKADISVNGIEKTVKLMLQSDTEICFEILLSKTLIDHNTSSYRDVVWLVTNGKEAILQINDLKYFESANYLAFIRSIHTSSWMSNNSFYKDMKFNYRKTTYEEDDIKYENPYIEYEYNENKDKMYSEAILYFDAFLNETYGMSLRDIGFTNIDL